MVRPPLSYNQHNAAVTPSNRALSLFPVRRRRAEHAVRTGQRALLRLLRVKQLLPLALSSVCPAITSAKPAQRTSSHPGKGTGRDQQVEVKDSATTLLSLSQRDFPSVGEHTSGSATPLRRRARPTFLPALPARCTPRHGSVPSPPFVPAPRQYFAQQVTKEKAATPEPRRWRGGREA